MRGWLLKAALPLLASAGAGSQVPAGLGGALLPDSGGAWSDYPEVAPEPLQSTGGGDVPAQRALASLRAMVPGEGPPTSSTGSGAPVASTPLRVAVTARSGAALGGAEGSTAKEAPPIMLETDSTEKKTSRAEQTGAYRFEELPSVVVSPRIEGTGAAPAAEGGSPTDEVRRLSEENEQLRSHLERWRRLGERVAERDRRLEQLLARSGLLQSSATLPANQSDKAAALPAANQAALIGAEQRVEEWAVALPRYALAFALVAVVALLAAAAWRRYMLQKQAASAREAAWRPGCMKCFAPLGRRLGLMGAVVEVSELRVGHLGGLPPGEMVRVRLQPDGGEAMCTEAKTRGRGHFVTFEKVFKIRQPRGASGGSWNLLVVDGANTPVARAQVSSAELLDAAVQHREFFSFALQTAGGCRLGAEDAGEGEQAGRSSGEPSIAMRVREAGSPRLSGSPFEGLEPPGSP